MVTSPQPGSFFVVRTNGWAAQGIRLITRSHVNHAGIYMGQDQVVEAQPSGARYGHASDYPNAAWSDLPLTPTERLNIIREATRLIGTPYSWVDCAAIGLADLFGWHVPELVRKRLNRVDRMMCSQLVDTAYLHAGVHLFNDGRIPGDVSPGDLETVLHGTR